MQQIDLTVLFATRNGEQVLPRTLSAYRGLDQSNIAWKLVVVDNGSTDSTSDIIKSYEKHLPLTVLFEPVAGKNRALNRGLDAVAGQLVVLTDDDTLPSSSFLRAWAKFINARPEYGLFGGSITPLFETPPQPWLTADQELCMILFGTRNLPDGPAGPKDIFGGNMAVRRAVFDNGFRFNESIGPNGSSNYPTGSEGEFCLRVAGTGILCWFAKEPVVQHLVRPSQMTDKYLAVRAYRHGRGEACLRKGAMAEKTKHFQSGVHAVVMRQVAALRRSVLLHHRLRMLSPFPVQRRRAIYRYHWKRGFMDEISSEHLQ